MKAYKNLKILKFCIWAIVGLHLLFLVIALKVIRSNLIQTDRSSNELTGVKTLYYGSSFSYTNKSFEFVYDKSKNENGQHLYRTGNGYLQLLDTNDGILNLPAHFQNNQVETSFTRFPLVVPVTSSQKKSLIYYNSGYLIFLVIYSLLIFVQLGRYVRSLISGDSLTNSNLKLLYVIGVLVIIQPIVVYALQYFEM